MIKTPPIIVILTIDNIQKTVHLVQPSESWNRYDIFMDNDYQGQVEKAIKGWTVNTIPESPIQARENKGALVDAINNYIDSRINPNS
jgi:hypothetical protein